jgi:integrase
MGVSLRQKKYSSGKIGFYLDIVHEGERYYEFLRINTRKGDKDYKEKKLLAESIRSKRELEILSSEHGFIPKHRRNADFMKYYDIYINNYIKKDVRMVNASFEKFKKFYKKPKLPVKNLTDKIVLGFRDFLKNDPELSGETPYDYFSRFKRVVQQAYSDGLFVKNPCENVSIKKDVNKLKKNILTEEELQILANTECGNSEVKKAFLFACFTGLGEAEIRKLKWKRIVNDKLIIYREKTGEQIINDLPPTAIKLLGDKKEKEDYIFNLPTNTAVTKNLKNWLENAKIEKHITFYCGRHSYACLLLMNGANLKTVADLLGHSTTQHTVKYLNYIDPLKEKAINNLPNLLL